MLRSAECLATLSDAGPRLSRLAGGGDRGIDRVVAISDDSVGSGGAAAVTVASVKALRARGLKVTLINGHADVGSDLPGLDVEIVALGGRNLLEISASQAAVKGLYDRHVASVIAQWIAANDTARTIYHLHNWHKVLSPAVFSPLDAVSDRLFLSVHDYFLVCPNGAFYNFRSDQRCDLAPMSLQCLGTNCDRRNYGHKLWRAARHLIRAAAFDVTGGKATFLTPHEGMTPFLTRGGIRPAQIVTLRNPVTAWHAERVQAEANREIFFIGRVSRDKGVDVLAEAAAAAGIRLSIIGDGPLREPLRQAFPQHEFLGWQSPAAISQLTRTARLVAVPTRWPETFGLVTFEALLSGIPVLISDAALVAPEIVARGMGVACDPADVSGMAGLLRRLADADEAIAGLSRRAFETGPAISFNLDDWCERLLEIYEMQLAKTTLAPNRSATEARSAA